MDSLLDGPPEIPQGLDKILQYKLSSKNILIT